MTVFGICRQNGADRRDNYQTLYYSMPAFVAFRKLATMSRTEVEKPLSNADCVETLFCHTSQKKSTRLQWGSPYTRVQIMNYNCSIHKKLTLTCDRACWPVPIAGTDGDDAAVAPIQRIDGVSSVTRNLNCCRIVGVRRVENRVWNIQQRTCDNRCFTKETTSFC